MDTDKKDAAHGKVPHGLAHERTSPQDLCITFEANGEKFTICIPHATLKSKSRSEIVKLFAGDPISCGICCAQKSGGALCLARCLYGDGKCCDSGKDNCS